VDLFHAMNVFVSVADNLSFSQAARALHMSRPSVTRAVAFVEEDVGAQLLVRTTRSVALTPAGELYLRDCRRILESVQEARDVASGSHAELRGEVVITAPTMFGRLHVLPVLEGFLTAHPEVRARALLVNRIVDLVDEGVDVGVRIGPLRRQSHMAARVGQVSSVVVASPGYLAGRDPITHPDDLSRHRIVSHLGAFHAPRWGFAGGDVALEPTVAVNDTLAALELAERGFGVTRLLSYQAADALARGALVRLLPDYELDPWPVHLVYPAGRRVPSRTRAFLDFATDALRARAASNWRVR
jgi:DNA-binding transcriptional LysR family regulator